MLKEIEKKINYEIDDNNCWNIISGSYKEKQGYHLISISNKRIRAHRAMYMAINGNIPYGMIIRHTCDNRDCINPDHLIIGTKKDNTQDMINRNRVSDWSDRKGKRKKLTNEQIIEIYNSNKSSYELSLLYPISDVQIRRIKNGSRCANITGHNI